MDIEPLEKIAQHHIDPSGLSNIAIREEGNEFVVALIDNEGFETVRGFGLSLTEAMNDLHRNLI